MKALIVEDSHAIARIIDNILRKLSFETIEHASDLDFAVMLVRGKNLFDLVFVDWDLKNNQGQKVVSKLRSIRKDICIVVIANSSRRDAVVSAAKCGANHYIVRPISEDNICAKIKPFIDAYAPESEDV